MYAPDAGSRRVDQEVETVQAYRTRARPDGVASDTLLERSSELARIDAALEDATLGCGRLVVVEGPTGIGKTALVDAARVAAERRGMRVLRARGSELEQDFAFGVVRQLFETLLSAGSEVERADLLQGDARLAATLLGLPGGADTNGTGTSLQTDTSFAILHGLYWLLANLSAVDPVLVVVDDVHAADVPSLRYLAYLVPRLPELDVALTLVTRRSDTGADAKLLTTLTGDPSAEVIRPTALSNRSTAHLVEAALGAPPDPALVAAFMRWTGGTPFLLRDLIDALRAEGVSPTADAVADIERVGAATVGRSLRFRLSRLPAHAAALARALAVLERSDLGTAAGLAHLGTAEAAEARALLVGAGIVQSGLPLEFVHPIVRDGLYADLPTFDRRRAHHTAARLLAERPTDHHCVVEHLLESEPLGDRWVVERLVAAAHEAARAGEPERAVVLLRRAVAEPPSADEEWGLLLELGNTEAWAGIDGWREHLELAEATAPDGASAVAAARFLARALSRSQRFEEAVAVLDRAARSIGPGSGRQALELESAAVVVGMNGPETALKMAVRRAALRGLADTEPDAPPELFGVAAFISVLANEPAEVGADLATRALFAAEGVASESVFARTTLALLLAERYRQARPLLEAAIAEGRSTGDGGRLAVGLANRAWLALRSGDLRSAEADARAALAATELPAPPAYRLLNGGVLVKALVDQGELDAAEQVLESFGDSIDSRSLTAAVLRLARGRLRLEQGRPADALDDSLAVGDLLTRSLVVSPAYLPWRSEAALAHHAVGDGDAARRLADEELQLARAFGAPRAIGVAARAAGLVAGGEHGLSLLEEAVEAFSAADAPLDRARALADLGAWLRRRNRRSEARPPLREAIDAAHRAGAKALAAYAETELRATGARPRRVLLSGVESLTASELRIAELARTGLTNREIAQTLFITARTVEGHLTSVFRKLDVDSRSGLRTALVAGEAS